MKSRTAKLAITLENAEKLQGLINNLLAFNEIEPVYDFAKQGKDPNSLFEIVRQQEAIQDEIDDLARGMHTFMGRQIKFPMADSFAYYIVTRVMKDKGLVEITWVKYCDAWQDGRAGEKSVLSYDYAATEINGQDKIRELFGNKQKETI